MMIPVGQAEDFRGSGLTNALWSPPIPGDLRLMYGFERLEAST